MVRVKAQCHLSMIMTLKYIYLEHQLFVLLWLYMFVSNDKLPFLMYKTLIRFLTIFLFAWGVMLHNAQAQSSSFITRWDLSITGGTATTLRFGVATAGAVSYTWQQVGGSASGTGTFGAGTLTITGLPANAIIDLSIDPANFRRIILNFGTDRQRLMEIKQWGTVAWTGMQNAFRGCSNMTLTATDVPNFAAVTDMSSMFNGCSAFNQSVSNFNTEKVTNMSAMFSGCDHFNQSVSNFNTSAVTDMSSMFNGCYIFNQSVSNFNTEKVTTMIRMFKGCPFFNQPVSNFNTTAVTDMSSMFDFCYYFNQSVSNFNTEKVTTMSYMFYQCGTFNQSVSNFNTKKVTDMSSMFNGCSAFNQSVSNFNTAAVYNMSLMFNGCSAFNQSVSNFNTAAVNFMDFMFNGCSAFNQSVSNFNIEKVTSMFNMFEGCSAFNQNLASWGSQLNPIVTLYSFLNNCGMSVSNYDATLTAFAAGAVTGRSMGATSLKYCNAVAARSLLTTPIASGGKGWTISGDTKNCTIANVITISPERPAICAGTSITMTASGCTGTLTWFGGGAPIQTGPSVSLSPALTTSYSVNCSTGGSETFTIVVAANTVAVGYNVVTGKERFKAITILTSAKKVGNVHFTPAANVIYEAGNSITLLPGFTAEKSSTFQAEIRACQ